MEMRSIPEIAAIVADALHEPPQRAWRIATRARLDAARRSREGMRCLARLARGDVRALRTSVAETRQLDAFADYVASEPAPKLVFAIHAGGFLVNAIRALIAAPAGVCAHVPVPARSLAALEGVARFAETHGKRVCFHPIKTGAALPLRRVADRNDLAFILLDLGAEYGRTSAQTLFGAPAHLVRGPYVLARRLGASVAWLDSTPALSFSGPFDDCTHRDAPAADVLGRRFAARIEATIRRDPAAWSRWHTLPALRRDTAPQSC
jgi:predicted LPLAT superfamily acyltransferase